MSFFLSETRVLLPNWLVFRSFLKDGIYTSMEVVTFKQLANIEKVMVFQENRQKPSKFDPNEVLNLFILNR